MVNMLHDLGFFIIFTSNQLFYYKADHSAAEFALSNAVLQGPNLSKLVSAKFFESKTIFPVRPPPLVEACSGRFIHK